MHTCGGCVLVLIKGRARGMGASFHNAISQNYARKTELNRSEANRLQVWSLHHTPVRIIRATWIAASNVKYKKQQSLVRNVGTSGEKPCSRAYAEKSRGSTTQDATCEPSCSESCTFPIVFKDLSTSCQLMTSTVFKTYFWTFSMSIDQHYWKGLTTNQRSRSIKQRWQRESEEHLWGNSCIYSTF